MFFQQELFKSCPRLPRRCRNFIQTHRFIAPFPAFAAAFVCLLFWSEKLRHRSWRFLAWLKNKTVSLFRDRLWRFHLLGVGLFWGLNVVSLGVPGAGVLYFHVTILSLLKMNFSIPTGDNAWPAFVLTGFAWPLGFLFGHYITQTMTRHLRITIYAICVLSWGFLISAGIAGHRF